MSLNLFIHRDKSDRLNLQQGTFIFITIKLLVGFESTTSNNVLVVSIGTKGPMELVARAMPEH